MSERALVSISIGSEVSDSSGVAIVSSRTWKAVFEHALVLIGVVSTLGTLGWLQGVERAVVTYRTILRLDFIVVTEVALLTYSTLGELLGTLLKGEETDGASSRFFGSFRAVITEGTSIGVIVDIRGMSIGSLKADVARSAITDYSSSCAEDSRGAVSTIVITSEALVFAISVGSIGTESSVGERWVSITVMVG